MGSCFSSPDSDSSEEDSPGQRPARRPPPAPNAAATTPGSTPNTVTPTTPARRPSAKGKSRSSSSVRMKPILNALRTYATLPNPGSSLPASTLLLSNHNTIAIWDAYPKAKYHFLVLPRYPFPPQSNPESRKSIVKSVNYLDDLRSLILNTPREVAEQVINAMADTAREVEEMIRDEMVKTEGFEWRINVGFHAIPSMKHVHLHVISEDRISDAMKTKKHHNSFRPDLGFFISIQEVQRWFGEEDEYILARVEALQGTDSLLSSPLTCFKCDEPFHNMPTLKKHLEKEFAEEKAKALKRIAKHGRQQTSSDEGVF